MNFGASNTSYDDKVYEFRRKMTLMAIQLMNHDFTDLIKNQIIRPYWFRIVPRMEVHIRASIENHSKNKPQTHGTQQYYYKFMLYWSFTNIDFNAKTNVNGDRKKSFSFSTKNYFYSI